MASTGINGMDELAQMLYQSQGTPVRKGWECLLSHLGLTWGVQDEAPLFLAVKVSFGKYSNK